MIARNIGVAFGLVTPVGIFKFVGIYLRFGVVDPARCLKTTDCN